MKRVILILAVTAIAVICPTGVAVAGPSPWSLSPNTVTFTTSGGSFDYHFVTVSNGTGALVIQNPASFNDNHFFDTQAGSCWQGHEVFGRPIPSHRTCTIQVGFHSDNPGSFTATMTVYRCTAWMYVGPTNSIVCTTLDGSNSVSLAGNAT